MMQCQLPSDICMKLTGLSILVEMAVIARGLALSVTKYLHIDFHLYIVLLTH